MKYFLLSLVFLAVVVLGLFLINVHLWLGTVVVALGVFGGKWSAGRFRQFLTERAINR